LSNYELHRHRVRPDRWKISLSTQGEEASRLWIFDKIIRIGTAGVRIGGIGGVGTENKHRLKGYASLIMNESTRFMEEHGYDLGFLYGIPDFYDRFGYGVCFGDSILHLKTADLQRATPDLRTRAYKTSDARAIRRLYNTRNAGLSGSVIRPPSWKDFGYSPGFKSHGKAVVAVDTAGRIAGYAAYTFNESNCLVYEIAGRHQRAFTALSAAIAGRARRAKCKNIDFHVPTDGEFAEFCMRFGYRSECQRPRNAGPMARIIQLEPLFGKLLPQLNLRLKTHRVSFKETIHLKTDIGDVKLKAGPSSLRLTGARGGIRVRMPQLILAQLILGYRSVSDIINDPGVQIPPNGRPLLQILFPKHNAYMWWSDRF
jgi:predicted acetyltransferase